MDKWITCYDPFSNMPLQVGRIPDGEEEKLSTYDATQSLLTRYFACLRQVSNSDHMKEMVDGDLLIFNCFWTLIEEESIGKALSKFADMITGHSVNELKRYNHDTIERLSESSSTEDA
jgi:hypothetical protein